MTKNDIEAALTEAKRFEERANEMLRLMQEYEDSKKRHAQNPATGLW